MIKTLLILAALLFSGALSAQADFRFADSTAQWNMGYRYVYGNFTYVHTICGDTILSGTSYQNVCLQDYGILGFIRKDSAQKVFLKTAPNVPEQKIYDFGKTVGDTIWDIQDPTSGADSFLAIVRSADSIFIGKWRKQLHISYFYFSNYRQRYEPTSTGDTIRWVEGIGAMNAYTFWPILELVATDMGRHDLQCYFEEDILLYHDTSFDTCVIEQTTGIKLTTNPQIFLFPNPASNNIVIELESHSGPTTFKLFDITGRLLLQKPLTEKTTRLDLDGLAKGIYLYNIYINDRKNYSGKLVIE